MLICFIMVICSAFCLLSHSLPLRYSYLRRSSFSLIFNSVPTNSNTFSNTSKKMSVSSTDFSLNDKYQEADLEFYNQLKSCDDKKLASSITSALNVLGDALRLFGPRYVVASYNGGKDADVVMHLMRAAVAKYSADQGKLFRPTFIYFAIKDEIPEVMEHLERTKVAYSLHIERYDCGNFT